MSSAALGRVCLYTAVLRSPLVLRKSNIVNKDVYSGGDGHLSGGDLAS